MGVMEGDQGESRPLISNSFFIMGPNDNFVILGLRINTPFKYFALLTYCMLNSCIRGLYNNVLHSWLINVVQSPSVKNKKSIKFLAYYAGAVGSVYLWLDWVMTLNILLAQVDMVLAELSADLLIMVITTAHFLKSSEDDEDGEDAKEENIYEGRNNLNQGTALDDMEKERKKISKDRPTKMQLNDDVCTTSGIAMSLLSRAKHFYEPLPKEENDSQV